MNNIFLVIGLGNPGQEYERTRHNVGFHVIDSLSEKFTVPLTPQKSCASLVGKINVEGVSIMVAKPTTFMNRSGQAMYSLLRWYKIPPERCIVVTDNVDLNAGVLRAKKKGSGGTHNGIRSIQAHIKSVPNGLDYVRLYVGVGSARPHQPLSQYVLGKWDISENDIFAQAFDKAADSIVSAVKDAVAKDNNNLQELLAKYIAASS